MSDNGTFHDYFGEKFSSSEELSLSGKPKVDAVAGISMVLAELVHVSMFR
jgi:hypothetical protein